MNCVSLRFVTFVLPLAVMVSLFLYVPDASVAKAIRAVVPGDEELNVGGGELEFIAPSDEVILAEEANGSMDLTPFVAVALFLVTSGVMLTLRAEKNVEVAFQEVDVFDENAEEDFPHA